MLARTVLVAATLLACRVSSAQERVDLLLHGGKIATQDDSSTIASAVAVRGGRIVAVGDESLVRRYRAGRLIDLRGRLVIPGFNDSHIHIAGVARRQIDLRKVRSIRELRDSVRRRAAQLGTGEWITGFGWAEDDLEERRTPLRADLDSAAPANPVILWRAGGHSSVSSSLALRLAGIDRTTANPAAGMIERDERGDPTGIIRERSDIVDRLVPEPAADELRPSFVRALRALLPLGITSIVQAGATPRGPDGYAEWERVYRTHRGELPRAAVQIYWSDSAALLSFGRHPGDGDAWLRVGALKLLVDGGFTGPSAYTLQPYRGMADFRGTLNYSPDSLYHIVKVAHAMGWQMGFHTIGDGAIELAVNVFDRVLRESPRSDHRNYLNHFSMLPPEATLQAMARDSILVTQQPNFTYTLEARYAQTLDGERLQHNNPVALPMRRGIFMAFSSDVLPIGPMVGLYAAVARRGKSGAVYGADEAIPIARAIRAYTRDGAYLTREEKIKGTIEPGRLADMVVMADDLLSIPPEKIPGARVDLTILGGRIVYDRAAVSSTASPRQRSR